MIQSRIRAVLPNAEIEHVGSTAIPGSLTKGDLDVLVRVDRSSFQGADRVLAEMFSRNQGSDKTDSFSAFADSSLSPELGVQLVVVGTEFDTFVDWVTKLTSDGQLRASYDELKANFHGKDMIRYREAKANFIAQNLRD
jgi:GrpB-like predicted nucleotidyltransferase (UPF0157 family)